MICESVKQHYVATYLGIAPESLSRIKKALKECEEKGIKGKRITPFLLSKVKDLTEGSSLEANIKLVLNNAELGARIAAEL